jgi:hypothetical protein
MDVEKIDDSITLITDRQNNINITIGVGLLGLSLGILCSNYILIFLSFMLLVTASTLIHSDVHNLSKNETSCFDQILIGRGARAGYMAALLTVRNPSSERPRACIAIDGIYTNRRKHKGFDKFDFDKFDPNHPNYHKFPIYLITDDTPPVLLISTPHNPFSQDTLDFHYMLKQSGVYVVTVYPQNEDELQTAVAAFINEVETR